ncbi:MAG: hypothetical protein V3W33_01495 [Gammaproteobacteria bacterium]|jgi:glutamate-ammonia-ligase adenylyltransferase
MVARDFNRLIRQAADPEAATIRLERLLGESQTRRHIERLDEKALLGLVSVIGISNFLFNFIMRHPEAISHIGKRPRRTARLGHPLNDIVALQQLKYCELLKITWMDLEGVAPYEEVLAAISGLADIVLSNVYSPITLSDTKPSGSLPLCWIGMGKLGAGELNYSSDVDLIFVYSEEDVSDKDFEHKYQVVVEHIHSAMRTLEQVTEEGFLYRVDLKLRPWGRDGPLALPIDEMEHYYEASSEAWERLAWLRARPVAGALKLGNDLVNRLEPFVYRRSLGSDDLERLIEIKTEMAHVRERPGCWNVKLSEGGIRDLEFFVNVLQLLYGAEDAGLRTPNTLMALDGLVNAGLIETDEGQQLRETYLFLRRLENRLQMIDERQTHDLPNGRDQRLVLARSLGYRSRSDATSLQRFEEALEWHRAVARAYFERILPGQLVI